MAVAPIATLHFKNSRPPYSLISNHLSSETNAAGIRMPYQRFILTLRPINGTEAATPIKAATRWTTTTGFMKLGYNLSYSLRKIFLRYRNPHRSMQSTILVRASTSAPSPGHSPLSAAATVPPANRSDSLPKSTMLLTR